MHAVGPLRAQGLGSLRALPINKIPLARLPKRSTIVTASHSNHRGFNNRLGPTRAPSSPSIGVSSSYDKPSSSASDQGLLSLLCTATNDFAGRILYKYYNWRQDTLSDLQLFAVINTGIIGIGAAIGAAIRRHGVEASGGAGAIAESISAADPSTPPWWTDLYSVLVVILGQQLPEEHAEFSQQLFGVVTALLGLASFALILALIEQATLEMLEHNVRRGSKVYECGHYVVLAWGESARDLSQAATLLRQLCAASASQGGAVIVVLAAHREKLDLETIFRESLPLEARLGSEIVFRQGMPALRQLLHTSGPLDPGALNLVGITDARAVVISGDYSRPSEDSDAQVLRCAVLVDEMSAAAGKEWAEAPSTWEDFNDATSTATCSSRGPWVVAEVQGLNAPALLNYACTDRVIPVPSSLINARRFARLLRHPAIATLSHALFDHTSHAYVHIGYFPEAVQLLGQPYSAIHAFFPDTTIIGVTNVATGHSELSPPPNRRLHRGEALIMLRGAATKDVLRPLDKPMPGYDPGREWDPSKYSRHSMDEAPLGKSDAISACSSGYSSAIATVSIDDEKPENTPRAAAPRTYTQAFSQGPSHGRWLGWKNASGEAPSQIRRLAAAVVPLSFGSTAAGVGGGSDLLICGWNGGAAMGQLLKELDHGIEALPQGSKVILINAHTWEEITLKCRLDHLTRLELRHVHCDPRDRFALASAIDVSTLRAAIILHDTKWAVRAGAMGSAAAADASPYSLSQSDMLRMDAMCLEVMLNVRYLLESACCPDINIISEKLTYLGQTRFEDRRLLPLGTAVNSASFSAKVLAKVAVQRWMLNAYSRLGQDSDIVVQDAEAFAEEGESLSFLGMQARCASVGQVLLGFYNIPTSMDEVLNIMVNPGGQEERSRARVWNSGDARCKLITLVPKLKKAHEVIPETAAAKFDFDDESAASVVPFFTMAQHITECPPFVHHQEQQEAWVQSQGAPENKK